MLAIKKINLGKQLLVSLAFVALSLVTTLSLDTKAYAYTDGLHWAECQGRFTVGSVSLPRDGRMTAWGCSNGHFFVTTTSSYHTSTVASITRESPWGQQLRSAYGYSNSSNMLAMINGACYNAWGSISNLGGNGFRFCW